MDNLPYAKDFIILWSTEWHYGPLAGLGFYQDQLCYFQCENRHFGRKDRYGVYSKFTYARVDEYYIYPLDEDHQVFEILDHLENVYYHGSLYCDACPFHKEENLISHPYTNTASCFINKNIFNHEDYSNIKNPIAWFLD